MSAPSHTTQEVTLGLLDQLGQAATSMMGATGNQSPLMQARDRFVGIE